MSSTQKPTDSTDNKQPTPTAQNSGMTRRDLLRRSTVGGATLAGVSTGAIRLDHGPVQESEAIAPAVAAAGVAGGTGGAALGWALREFEVLGSDTPTDDLGPDALHEVVYTTMRTRESTNADSIVDNKNILDGIEYNAYSDGKLAAIEKLNEEETEENVLGAAHDAVDEYLTTVMKNLINTWNESVNELEGVLDSISDSSLSTGDVFDEDASISINPDDRNDWFDYSNISDRVYEFPNGDTEDVLFIFKSSDNDRLYSLLDSQSRETDGGASTPSVSITFTHPDDGSNRTYLNYSDWGSVWSSLEDTYDQVTGELEKYVENIYADVQSGSIDTAELLTPREQAEITTEDEDFPQAIADLQALNVGLDLEREAEIYLPDPNATVFGQIGYTGEYTLEVGEIDPEDKDGSIYLTYDISQGQGEWSAHEDGIDGGTLTFTAEPFVDTIYYVDTVSAETVELTADDFEEDDDGDEWTVDLSDDLDDAITEVDQIEYYSETEETQYETIQLQDTFEIVRFTDSDGNEYEESNFERSEPHTNDNYITEEEWQEQQERQEELIETYEDAQGGGVTIPGFDEVLSGEANGLIGIAVVGLVFVFGILSALNPLS